MSSLTMRIFLMKRADIYLECHFNATHITDDDETNINFNNDNKNTSVPLVFWLLLLFCLFVSVLEDFLDAVNITDCGLVKSGS